MSSLINNNHASPNPPENETFELAEIYYYPLERERDPSLMFLKRVIRAFSHMLITSRLKTNDAERKRDNLPRPIIPTKPTERTWLVRSAMRVISISFQNSIDLHYSRLVFSLTFFICIFYRKDDATQQQCRLFILFAKFWYRSCSGGCETTRKLLTNRRLTEPNIQLRFYCSNRVEFH